MMALAEQQEVLIGAADIIMDVYAMESAILRAQKLAAAQGRRGGAATSTWRASSATTPSSASSPRPRTRSRPCRDGDELRTLLAALTRFTKHTPINTVAARHRIADAMIRANRYVY